MPRRLLLIGWDAADWKILHPLSDAGEMPTLRRLVDGGASGELLAAQPIIPTISYTSIMTGKRAWQHGICHSVELAEDGRHCVSIAGTRRHSTALWQMLAYEGKKCLVVGWPATHGETPANTIIVSDRYPEPTAGPGVKPWPSAMPGTYWPRDFGQRLDSKRVSPEEIGANVISQYVPEWRKINQKRDRRIGQLRLFLAADYSYQTAAMTLLKEEKWDFAAIRFPALAPMTRIFLPYHLSPERSNASEDHAHYKNVIRVGCRILDQMLCQLIELAGPTTAVIVVSEHGSRTRNVPLNGFSPRDHESWKSPHGIFAAHGPGFAPDALLHGAGILDVAPTVLTWFGLPLGDDMEGRVLVESFSSVPEISRVESWESWMGTSLPSVAGNSDVPNQGMAAKLQREADWNFVQSCLDAMRHAEALPVLEKLFREFPERVEVGHALFQCQLALKLLTEASETLEIILESLPAGIASLLPRAELALAQSDLKRARTLVTEIRNLNPRHPLVLRKLGLMLLRLREWDALADLAKQALNLDEQDAIAWLGLAAAQLRQGNANDAVNSAQRAIGLKYFLADAHFILARGFVALGRWQEAKEAMQTLLKLQPNNRAAAKYYQRMPPENNSPETSKPQ